MELDYLCGALLLFMFAIPLSAQSLNATDELTQGVQALKRNSPADAVRHFKTAISLDDKLVDAHLNLAAA